MDDLASDDEEVDDLAGRPMEEHKEEDDFFAAMSMERTYKDLLDRRVVPEMRIDETDVDGRTQLLKAEYYMEIFEGENQDKYDQFFGEAEFQATGTDHDCDKHIDWDVYKKAEHIAENDQMLDRAQICTHR